MEIPGYLPRIIDEQSKLSDLFRGHERALGSVYNAMQAYHNPALNLAQFATTLPPIDMGTRFFGQDLSGVSKLAAELSQELKLDSALHNLTNLSKYSPGSLTSISSLAVHESLKAQSRLSDVMRTIDGTNSAFKGVFQQMRELGRTTEFYTPALKAALLASHIPDFDQSFLVRLQVRLNELVDEDADAEQVITEVKSAVETKMTAEPSWVTYLGLRDLLFALIPALLTIYYGNVTEQHIVGTLQQEHLGSIERLDEILKAIRGLHEGEMARLQSVKPTETPTDLFMIERTMVLRADRREKAPKIAVAYPNQIVRVIRISKAWVYVEFFDYLEMVPRTGWMYKKYTKRLSGPR